MGPAICQRRGVFYNGFYTVCNKEEMGAWLAQSVERATLGRGVINSSLVLGGEIS